MTDCTHQTLLTLRHEEFQSNQRILYCEYNEPYGFCPQEFYDEWYIHKFVAETYYDEHYGGKDYEPVWKLIRETRQRFYDEFGMETAYGSETNEVNRLTDEAMTKHFREQLEQWRLWGDLEMVSLYSKALKLMEY